MTLPRLHSSTNAASFGLSLRGASRERMLGGDRAEGDAHERVGARGEHPELLLLAVELVRETRSARPRLLPIQFACIGFTRSGQPGSSSSAASSSSA